MIRKLASALALGLAILVLYGLQKTMPTYGDITSPVALSGRTGEKLSARDFELTVKTIRLARQVKLRSFGKDRIYDTSGVWALVEVDAAARNETVTLTSAAWLAPNGARYKASERFSASAPGLLASQRLEPGLPARALVVFEFPESQVHGGRILVARTPFQPLDSELRITADLPADPVIHPAITLARGRSLGDWSLEAE